MTSNRWIVSLGTLVVILLFAVGLTQFREVGRAEAQAELIDAGVLDASPPTSSATRPTLVSPVANDPRGLPPVVAPAVETPRAAELDASDVQRMWKSGQIIGAIAVAVFLALTLLLKLDPKRAFYWTSGLSAVGIVVDAVAAGSTNLLPTIVTAATVLIAILARGPGSPPKS